MSISPIRFRVGRLPEVPWSRYWPSIVITKKTSLDYLSLVLEHLKTRGDIQTGVRVNFAQIAHATDEAEKETATEQKFAFYNAYMVTMQQLDRAVYKYSASRCRELVTTIVEILPPKLRKFVFDYLVFTGRTIKVGNRYPLERSSEVSEWMYSRAFVQCTNQHYFQIPFIGSPTVYKGIMSSFLSKNRFHFYDSYELDALLKSTEYWGVLPADHIGSLTVDIRADVHSLTIRSYDQDYGSTIELANSVECLLKVSHPDRCLLNIRIAAETQKRVEDMLGALRSTKIYERLEKAGFDLHIALKNHQTLNYPWNLKRYFHGPERRWKAIVKEHRDKIEAERAAKRRTSGP